LPSQVPPAAGCAKLSQRVRLRFAAPGADADGKRPSYRVKETPMDKLATLIDLLTCSELEPDEVETYAAAVRGAQDDPELDWMDDPSEAELMQMALQFQLCHDFVEGDKIDEFHEQVSDIFESPLPPFPTPANKMDFLPDDYFVWLDRLLAARPANYELLLWGRGVDDMLRGLVVKRADTDRILELAGALDLVVERSTRRQLT
jgi:hypothetical protein